MTEPRKFSPSGPLALEPRAFGMFLLMPYLPTVDARAEATVLSVRGPLMQFADPFCESYEAIVARVAEALSASPRAIVLSISSPGGVVSGCFEAATKIRAMCDAAAVPLVAYVDGQACSAAYALACAAPRIVASPTSTIGSIGVIAEVVDATARNLVSGVTVRMLASGARKADGNPGAGIIEAGALNSMQGIVDKLAARFFEFVAVARGIDAGAVQALEAACFIGADAQSMSLTDATQTLDELLASIGVIATTVAGPSAPQETEASAGAAQGDPMQAKTTVPQAGASKAYEDAIAALRKCASGDDEDAAKAKRMLKAELDEPAKEPDGDEPAKPAPAPAPDKAATSAEFPPKKEPDGDEKEDTNALRADVDALKASHAAAAAAAVALERATLLASRPDFAPEHLATLATAPIEFVRAQVTSIPRGPSRKPAALATVTGLRGEGQGDGSAAHQTPEMAAAMDRAMGLANVSHTGVVDNGNTLILGATVPGKRA